MSCIEFSAQSSNPNDEISITVGYDLVLFDVYGRTLEFTRSEFFEIVSNIEKSFAVIESLEF